MLSWLWLCLPEAPTHARVPQTQATWLQCHGGWSRPLEWVTRAWPPLLKGVFSEKPQTPG